MERRSNVVSFVAGVDYAAMRNPSMTVKIARGRVYANMGDEDAIVNCVVEH